MATITIAADGTGDYTAPDSNAYAALSTGTTENIVNWKSGVYSPVGGRWWGRAAARAMTKRCTHQITGNGLVVFDARIFVPFTSSPSVTWHAASGTWRIELYTVAGGGTVSDIRGVWFGAETGNIFSDIVIGQVYRQADSLGQCNADGLTVAGMSTGAGIWYPATEISTVDATNAQVIYVWCPQDDTEFPAVQWGGIAAIAEQGGSSSDGTPRYSPLVFARDSGASSNDPSGSSVGPGFVVIGAGKNLIGSTYLNDADPSLPVSDVHYDSITMYCAGLDAFYTGSDQAGTVYSNWRLDGEWSYDDGRDPLTFPEFVDQNDRSCIFIADRSSGIEANGGSILIGNTHGAVQINGSGASGETRCSNISITDVTMTARPFVNDARWSEIKDSDNAIIARCTVKGFCTRGQFGGTNTLIFGNKISEWKESSINSNWSTSVVRIYNAGDDSPSTVSVKVYANFFDWRDTESDWAYAPIDIRAFASDTYPAGCLIARDNVMLLSSGQGAVRTAASGGGTISSNQTVLGTYTNATVEALSGSSDSSIGTSTTLSSLFSTGTTETPEIDTAENILSRGDIPIFRSARETAGATSC